MTRGPGILVWNERSIAAALHLTADDVREYFTDGRRVSFLIERRIAREVMEGTLAKSQGARYDVLDPKGGKWEVRSISRGGIFFCPSYMVGSGRRFDEPGFLRKLEEIEGYVVADIESFPRVPFWIVDTPVVRRWRETGQLGKNSRISRPVALRLMRSV